MVGAKVGCHLRCLGSATALYSLCLQEAVPLGLQVSGRGCGRVVGVVSGQVGVGEKGGRGGGGDYRKMKSGRHAPQPRKQARRQAGSLTAAACRRQR